MEEKITLEDNEIIGAIGKILNYKLTKKECEICNKAKNKASGRILSKHWKEALKGLSKFRNHMEEIMFKEHRERMNEAGFENIYYGGKDRIKIENNIVEWIKKYLSTIEKLKKENSNR